MPILLMHPPLDDPTLPYHSTAYLKGHLASLGILDVLTRDLNIEYVAYLTTPSTVLALYSEADSRVAALENKKQLSFQEQEMYHGLLASERPIPESITNAIQVMRNRENFLAFSHYKESINVLVSYMRFVGSLCYPAEHMGFNLRTRGRLSTYSIADLLDSKLGEDVCYPLRGFMYSRLMQDPSFAAAHLFGISIVYDHQLYYALHLARLVREIWPDKRLILGGTAISQLYKHLKNRNLLKGFFQLCDAIVIGEGETALSELALAGNNIQGQRFTNTITYVRETDELLIPQVKYENVASLGSPSYDHPWDLYLSPTRGVNYSPTRGCYWNRCTFCDYGLNTDSPTSPWRERKISDVIADLRKAQDDFGVNYVYFAVDVMAPGYLERLSDAILADGLTIKWSAELRMEKIFSADRCLKMAQAGCVCVSFGMESGNQRILDLIDKGTKIEHMAQTMKNFAAAGIACQLMAFTEFPTETAAEKEETYQFIAANKDNWATGGMGTFLLTGTSIIARKPELFNISTVETEDADVARAIAYRVDNEDEQKATFAEEADASFDETAGIFPAVLGRPWAGGTDTLHSMIYYETYGRSFFKNDSLSADETKITHWDGENNSLLKVHGHVVSSRINLETLVLNREKFLAYLKECMAKPAEPTWRRFVAWAVKIPTASAVNAVPQFWLLSGNTSIPLDMLVGRVLLMASTRDVRVEDILKKLQETVRVRFTSYLRELEKRGLISFGTDEGMLKQRRVFIEHDVVIHAKKTHVHAEGKLAPHKPDAGVHREY